MLKKVRIEVEEPTPDQAVAALHSYETAMLVAEAERFELNYRPPVSYDDFEHLFSRELIEEVIEYDASLPGYHARRVVAFRRLDGRMSNWNDSEPDELQSRA